MTSTHFCPDHSKTVPEQGSKCAACEQTVIKRRLSLIPLEALEACAAAFEDGAVKYGRNSFKTMTDAKWSDCIDSMLRHAHAFNAGQDLTEDSKISHLAGVMARAAMLIYWQTHQIGTDDR